MELFNTAELSIIASKYTNQKDFWLDALKDVDWSTIIEYDYPENATQKPNYVRLKINLDERVVPILMELSKKDNYTLHLWLVSICSLIIHKYSQRDNILVGFPNYNNGGDSNVINPSLGLSLNNFRHDTFKEFILKVKNQLLDVLKNQNYPLHFLISEISESDNLSLKNLFSIYVVLEEIHHVDDIIENSPDIIFSFNRHDDQLIAELIYNDLLFGEKRIKDIVSLSDTIFTNLLSDLNQTISSIDAITSNEKRKLIANLNSSRNHISDNSVYSLFLDQVHKNSNKIALTYKDYNLTYKELDVKIRELALQLLVKGVTNGTIVSILFNQNIDAIIGIMACMKIGATYLPIDPELPAERIAYMLRDSNCLKLLTNSSLLNKAYEFISLILEANEENIIVTPKRIQIKDINALPIPDRSLINYEEYGKFIGLALVKNYIAIQGTRGCPFNCAYCHKIWPKTHIIRSAENIFNEVKLYYDLGVRRFALIDDIFNLNIRNSKRFFELVIENELDVQFFFPNGVRGDILTPEYIDLMVKAGTTAIAFALETNSPRLQKLIGKNLKLEKFRYNIGYIAENYPHVILELFVMHGFPTETKEEALSTLEFIKSIKWLHFVYFNVLKIYPNTEMEAIELQNGVNRESIQNSSNLAYHELPDTLPFEKAFTKKVQLDFFNNYFLSEERLKHVLPYQLKVLDEDELIQKYDSYFPVKIRNKKELFEFIEMKEEEVNIFPLKQIPTFQQIDLHNKFKRHFKQVKADKDALKVLLIDLSQYFSDENDMLYDVVEAPFGLVCVLTYLNFIQGSKVNGKIVKSRVDFNSYDELKVLLEDFQPDVIGLRTLTFYKDFFYKALHKIRSWCKNAIIVTGGPYATSDYKNILLDNNVDVVCLGEGEVTFSEFISAVIDNNKHLPEKKVLEKIDGIVFNKNDNVKKVEVISYDVLNKNTAYRGINIKAPKISGDNPAYIIYTSGTTGNPKGTIIENNNLTQLIVENINLFEINSSDTWTLFHSLSFDFSVWEIFGTLLNGCKLLITPKELTYDPEAFLQLLAKENVTVLNITPTFFSNLLGSKKNRKDQKLPIRYVIFGGEKLNTSRLKMWKYDTPDIKFINMFGITETTIHVSFKELKEKDIEAGISNIGIALPSYGMLILDKDLSFRPKNMAGEICVSGSGVSRGYMNQPELTHEKFVQHEGYSTRFYRSGDYGRVLDNDEIEYLERNDRQIKIRGFRIEISEIEKAILSHKNVTNVVVLPKDEDDGNKVLCAYYVTNTEDLSYNEIADFLNDRLPYYMIPAFYIRINSIPLTNSGKLNIKLLPEAKSASTDEIKLLSPSNEVQEVLLGIWKEVLGRDNISINDNFFYVGGDSIKIIQIASKAGKLGYRVSMQEIFKNPTIEQQSNVIMRNETPAKQKMVKGFSLLIPVQLDFFAKNSIDLNLNLQTVFLRFSKKIGADLLAKVLKDLIETHDVFRSVFVTQENKIVQKYIDKDKIKLELLNYQMDELDIEELEQVVNQIYSKIDISNGPLFKFALFETLDENVLMLAIHHLIIDGVSWRILFDDLYTLTERYLENKNKEVLFKTSSYKEWSDELVKYSNSSVLHEELSYWSAIGRAKLETIPTAHQGEKVDDSFQCQSIKFDKDSTINLNTKANYSYNTKLNELLIAGLIESIYQFWGIERTLMVLEGHGRENLFRHIDLSRTVGWFTSIYPVLLKREKELSLSELIKLAKETIRQVPNNGIGYGILKNLTDRGIREKIGFDKRKSISFNYLGEFKNSASNDLFKITDNNIGKNVDDSFKGEYLLDVVGMIANNELVLSIHYNRMDFDNQTIEDFLLKCKENILKIADHCVQIDKPELTQTDLTYSKVNSDVLKHINDVYDLQDVYPLTSMQEGMLFHHLIDSNSQAYFEQMSLRVKGEIDIELVKKCLEILIGRYDILRTNFYYKRGNKPLQIISRSKELDFEYILLNKPNIRNKESQIQTIRGKDRERGFSLSSDSLIRFILLKLEHSKWEFIWSHHHMLMDGWCVQALIKEFFELYNNKGVSGDSVSKELPQYKEYIKWLINQKNKKSLDFWRTYLNGYNDLTNIPAIRRKNQNGYKEYVNKEFVLEFEQEIYQYLKDISANEKITLYTVFQATWAILISNYLRKNDIVFGSITTVRPSEVKGIENMLGLFINIIPVRVSLNEDICFTELCQQIHNRNIESIPYHYQSIAEIASHLKYNNPIVDHLIVFENYPILNLDLNNQGALKTDITGVSIYEQTNYDFTIIINAREDLVVNLKYNENQYSSESVKKLAGHYKNIFLQLIENRNIKIGDFELVNKSEKKTLLDTLNSNQYSFTHTDRISNVIDKQIKRFPNRVAIQDDKQVLTYKQLDSDSNVLAKTLVESGVEEHSIVAIYCDRSPKMISCILAILKLGAAYLPIEKNYPKERKELMIKDSGVKVILTDSNDISEFIDDCIIINMQLLNFMDQVSFKQPTSLTNTCAYILFTSGTTGRPKGTLISHRNVMSLFEASNKYFSFDENDIWCLFHSYCFDLSAWEIFGTFLYGGKLSIVSKSDTVNSEKLLSMLQNHNVTILTQTPSAFYNLESVESIKKNIRLSLKYIIFAGEALTFSKLYRWKQKYPEIKLVNMYGITETTIHVTYKEINLEDIQLNWNNVGKALDNGDIIITNNKCKLLPTGAQGEICVSGFGVSDGYLNNPELTTAKFEYNDNLGCIIYKSGDIGSFSESGELEYIGRKDRQVKIRGHRIETKEIENRALSHKDVKNAVVTVRDTLKSEKELVLYIVSEKRELQNNIKTYLQDFLPYYMIPSHVIHIDQLPMTSNNKIDVRKLPDVKSSVEVVPNIIANSKNEMIVSGIWKETLEIEAVDIQANFFDAGGNSLKIVSLFMRLRETLQMDFPLEVLFRYPTIQKFVKYVDSLDQDESTAQEIIPQQKTTEQGNRLNIRRKSIQPK